MADNKIVDQFIDFSSHAADSMMGRAFWDTEMTRLYGDQDMVNHGIEWAKGIPGVRQRLEKALDNGGLPAMKYQFVTELTKTQVGNIKGDTQSIFDRIRDWQPRETKPKT